MSQDAKCGKNGGKSPQIRSLALVALGANYPSGVGDPAEAIRMAIATIQKDIGVIRAESRLFRTPAFPAGSGPDFVNAAVALETDLPVEVVLAELHRIEAEFGRERKQRWGPRTLDLDLIGFDDVVMPDLKTFKKWADLPLDAQMQTAPDTLILPHPRMHERAFVLVPMQDVAPEWVHPVFGKSVSDMAGALEDDLLAEVQPL